MSKKKYITRTMTKYDDKGKPIMKVVPSGVPGKSDTLYNAGTRQWENKLTGKKGKKATLWVKRMSPEEFDGKPKIKLKKKSGGYRKAVKK
tara:strand:- start:216 stop:485 length:270 start_codon:yes stop_codon:yes gene_type:complete